MSDTKATQKVTLQSNDGQHIEVGMSDSLLGAELENISSLDSRSCRRREVHADQEPDRGFGR